VTTARGGVRRLLDIRRKARFRIDVVLLALRHQLVVPAASAAGLSTLVALFLAFVDKFTITGDTWLSAYWPLIIAVGFLSLGILLAVMGWEYQRRRNRFAVVPLDGFERARLRASVVLSASLEEAGFAFYLGPGEERFATSVRVNDYLREGGAEIMSLVRSPSRFVIPRFVLDYAPATLDRLLRDGRPRFNGRILGLRTEILPDVCTVEVQEVRYLEALVTEGLFHTVLRDQHSLDAKTPGRSLVLDDQSTLQPLSMTAATNYVGVSTLALTDDNWMWFQRQGRASGANPGRWAPPGSGSVDWRDWVRADGARSLHAVAGAAAQRELREEAHFGNWNPSLHTEILGYARLLDGAGKPDFFALTRVGATKERVEAHLRAATVTNSEYGFVDESELGSGISRAWVRVAADGVGALGEAVRLFMREHTKEGQSIQNHVFAQILEATATT